MPGAEGEVVSPLPEGEVAGRIIDAARVRFEDVAHHAASTRHGTMQTNGGFHLLPRRAPPQSSAPPSPSKAQVPGSGMVTNCKLSRR